MTFPVLALITLVIGVGSYLAFGALTCGYLLLAWALLQILGHLLGKP